MRLNIGAMVLIGAAAALAIAAFCDADVVARQWMPPLAVHLPCAIGCGALSTKHILFHRGRREVRWIDAATVQTAVAARTVGIFVVTEMIDGHAVRDWTDEVLICPAVRIDASLVDGEVAVALAVFLTSPVPAAARQGLDLCHESLLRCWISPGCHKNSLAEGGGG